MEHKGYHGRVEFDDEAGILHGTVTGIRDVVTFQGTSVEEVRQAFRDSVEDYLAFCAKRGEEPNKPFSGQFVARVGSELHRMIHLAATFAGKSANAWVTEQLLLAAKATLQKEGKGDKQHGAIWTKPKRGSASARAGGKQKGTAGVQGRADGAGSVAGSPGPSPKRVTSLPVRSGRQPSPTDLAVARRILDEFGVLARDEFDAALRERALAG